MIGRQDHYAFYSLLVHKDPRFIFVVDNVCVIFYFYFFNTVIELLNVNKPEPDLNTSF